MSNQSPSANLNPEENTYHPNPTAARILSRLIEFNFQPEDLPERFPREWLKAYKAVSKAAASGADRRERFHAFVQATKDYDFAMVQEVNDATVETVDRADQNRILYKFRDVLYPPPPVEWVVDGLFARSSFNLIVGDPGTKKTYSVIDLAMCVAMGKPWLGRAVQHGTVLFVDEETGYHQLWPRVHAAIQAHQAKDGTLFNFTSLAGYNLRDPQDAKQLRDRALALDADLIIIDALANLMRSNENTLASVQPVLFNLRRMADYCRAVVIVVHHTNRHGFFRGSSSIAASLDLMLHIISAADDPLIQFHNLKSRFSAPKAFAARAVFASDAEGQPLFHLEPADLPLDTPARFEEPASPRKGLTESILEFLLQHPNSTRNEIATQCSAFDSGSVFNSLGTLIDSGQVIRTNPGGKGTLGHYALPTELSSDLVK